MLNSDGPYLLHVSIDELRTSGRWCRLVPVIQKCWRNYMMQHQVNVSARFNPETLERVYAWCVIVVSTSVQ